MVDILTDAENESDKTAQEIYAEQHHDKKTEKHGDGVEAEMAQVYFAFWLAVGKKLIDIKHEKPQKKHDKSKKR